MDLESSDEGKERFRDASDDGILTDPGIFESFKDLRMEVHDVVEPIEEARDGHRNSFDPCSAASSQRKREDLDDASETIDEGPLGFAQLPDDFLSSHLHRTEFLREIFEALQTEGRPPSSPLKGRLSQRACRWRRVEVIQVRAFSRERCSGS